MSKKNREIFEQVKEGEPSKGFWEAAKEGIQAVAPGLSLSKILSEVGSEMSQMFDHGRTELAAALFRNHDAHVMYMKGQGQDQAEPTNVHGAIEKPQENAGREM